MKQTLLDIPMQSFLFVYVKEYNILFYNRKDR